MCSVSLGRIGELRSLNGDEYLFHIAILIRDSIVHICRYCEYYCGRRRVRVVPE